MIKNSSAIKLILVLSGLLVSAFLAELILRCIPSEFIYMNLRNIVQQMTSVPSVSIMGYEPKPGTDFVFSNREFRTKVHINKQGFRGKDVSLSKPENTTRIFTAGDSFVFGWGVEDTETFSAILQNNVKNTEFINLGVSGYSTEQALQRVAVYSQIYHPKIVLLCTTGLPALGGGNYVFRNGRMYYDLGPETPLIMSIHHWLLRRSALYVVLSHTTSIITKRRDDNAPDAAILDEIANNESSIILKSFKELSLQRGFVPVIIYIPYKADFLTLSARLNSNVAYLKSQCDKLGITFFDITSSLNQNSQEVSKIYFRLDDHWSKLGHQKAAEGILQFLFKKGLLK